MAAPEQPSRVRLVPSQGVEVVRTLAQPDYGGWDLTPVLGRCFVRQARGGGR